MSKGSTTLAEQVRRALYVPAIGPDHTRKAVAAAGDLLTRRSRCGSFASSLLLRY
jgi:hypothetical protein